MKEFAIMEANAIIKKLEKKLLKGNYENFGQIELRKYKDRMLASSLDYFTAVECVDYLRNKINEIQNRV